MSSKSNDLILNRVTATSVKKGSGKDWREWIQLLDEAGARHWTHQEIVAYLRRKKQSPWWRQIVASGYAVAIGRRAEGATLKGDYTLTCTKTVTMRAPEVWRWLLKSEGQQIWLQPLSALKISKGRDFETEDGAFGEFRVVEVNKRLRLGWQDADGTLASVFQIQLFPRAKGKCLIVFSHLKIPTPRLKTQLRERWRKALDTFAATIAT